MGESYYKEYLESDAVPRRIATHIKQIRDLRKSQNPTGLVLARLIADIDQQLDKAVELCSTYKKETGDDTDLEQDLMRARWVLGLD